MNIEVLSDPESAAQKAAAIIAAEARASVAQRSRFVVAFSGGHSPWIMLRALANEDVPWKNLFVVQVDERVAPDGDPDRNLTHLRESLLEHAPLRPEQIYAMPVGSPEPEASIKYALALNEIAGKPSILDLVHLGLGPDGHTASLVPGDPVLNITDADVGFTGIYMGRRRMTLTYPIINRSRRILWLITGADKTAMFPRLCAGDTSIPAGRVRQAQALIVADRAAAGDAGKSDGEGKVASKAS